MDVDTVWRSRSSDLPEAKATIESIKILFPPATSSPSHLLKQLHITIGHASPLPFLVFSCLRKEAATMIYRASVLAPAPPRSGVARRSYPWHGTARSPRTARCELAPAGRSWHTGCQDPGGSGPGAGACRGRRPGRELAGSGLRPARHRGGRRGH